MSHNHRTVWFSMGLLLLGPVIFCAQFDGQPGYLGFLLTGESGGGAGAETSSTATIDSFSFQATDNASLSADVSGSISGTTITLSPPLTVDLTALVATFATTGATDITESGTTQTSGTSALDYSSSKTLTLTAGDGTTIDYTVEISLDATDGLVLYMPFSGDANDSVGTNNGTVTGPTLTADRQGNASSAYLYGSGGEITLTGGPAVSATGSWTFALWIRPDSFGADTANSGNGDGDFILDRTPGANPLVNLKISHGQTYVAQSRNDSGSTIFQLVGTGATSGTWAHLVYVRDFGNDFIFYVDGAQVASRGSDALGSLTAPISILGNHVSFSSNFVTGVIDEYRVYDRALSAQEISNLANHVD